MIAHDNHVIRQRAMCGEVLERGLAKLGWKMINTFQVLLYP